MKTKFFVKRVVPIILSLLFFLLGNAIDLYAQCSPPAGDVNNNGTVDIVDALLTAQYYVGLNPENFNTSVADVNSNGVIDIVDALLIAQHYVGLITLPECLDGDWWDPNWQYRKELHILDPLPDYQMEITVFRDDGYDDANNGIIDCEGHCNSDFSDLRFVSPDNYTLCDYWIEEIIPDNKCRVWVETSGETSLHMYYGNTSAVDAGSGPDTFPHYFDHWTSDHTSQFQYCRGTNNNHQWTYTLNQFTQERKFVTTGNLSDYIYEDWDDTFIGFTGNLDSAYIDTDNYISLKWEHTANDVSDTSQVWVHIQTRKNRTTYTTGLQSLGSIPSSSDLLKVEINYTSREVSYVITNASTEIILAQDSMTDPGQIPDMATAKYFFIAAFDADFGIFEWVSPSTISWGNKDYNGGMRFDSDYWFVAEYADTAPLWSDFSDEESY